MFLCNIFVKEFNCKLIWKKTRYWNLYFYLARVKLIKNLQCDLIRNDIKHVSCLLTSASTLNSISYFNRKKQQEIQSVTSIIFCYCKLKFSIWKWYYGFLSFFFKILYKYCCRHSFFFKLNLFNYANVNTLTKLSVVNDSL